MEAYVIGRNGVKVGVHSKLFGDGEITKTNLKDVLDRIEEKLHYYIYRRDEYNEENIYAMADDTDMTSD